MFPVVQQWGLIELLIKTVRSRRFAGIRDRRRAVQDVGGDWAHGVMRKNAID